MIGKFVAKIQGVILLPSLGIFCLMIILEKPFGFEKKHNKICDDNNIILLKQ